MDFDMKTVQKLVGNITYEQMKDVDSFVSDQVSLFIPSTGPCQYSITPEHSHPGYSFILNYDNYCKVIVEGRRPITSKPGTLMAFSPGVKHHEKLSEGFTRYIAIMIDKKFFEDCIKAYSTAKPKKYKGDFFKPTNELRNYLKDFMIEYKNRLPGYKEILKAIEISITHSIIRIILNCKPGKEEISARMEINNIIEYMHANYDKKLSVEELSKNISLSSSHFSRIFKKETGKSPLEYLIQVRLEKAKIMLMSNKKSITDIAYDTGFNSSSHFASSFLKHFKISPTQFKQTI